jgi:hypothetical protein
MGLFGKLASKFNDVNPETNLSFADRLGAAGSGWNPAQLQALAQSRADQKRMMGAREQLLAAIEAQSAPRQMGPVMDEGIEPAASLRPDLNMALMQAAAQGLDISDLSKQQQYANPRGQIINGGDGSYGIFNPASGAVTTGQLPNQYQDLILRLKQAQIDAAEALAGQRKSSEGLNNVKAKAGGFAPRQPRAASKTLPPLPPGFVVSQ